VTPEIKAIPDRSPQVELPVRRAIPAIKELQVRKEILELRDQQDLRAIPVWSVVLVRKGILVL